MTIVAMECEKFVRPLEQVLIFEAPKTLKTHRDKTGYSEERVFTLFRQVKRWLWACASRSRDQIAGKPVPKTLVITPELKELDELWHTFMECKEEYSEFCIQNFGYEVQHFPLCETELESFRELRQRDPGEARRLRREQLRPQLEYLYDLLGPEVLKAWYKNEN